jgi:hypothetical protein
VAGGTCLAPAGRHRMQCAICSQQMAALHQLELHVVVGAGAQEKGDHGPCPEEYLGQQQGGGSSKGGGGERLGVTVVRKWSLGLCTGLQTGISHHASGAIDHITTIIAAPAAWQ